MQVYTVGSSLKQNSPIFHMMSRAHSFPRKNMPNSVGQLTKFRGKIVQILRLATASYLWLKTVQKLQLLKAGIILKADVH